MYAASMPDRRKRIEQFVTLSEAFRNAEVRFVAVDLFGCLDADDETRLGAL